MKSKIFYFVFLIFLFCITCQKSNSQSYTSIRFNVDSVLFDGSNVNIIYKSGCSGNISALKGCAQIIKPGGECGTPGNFSSASVGGSVEQGDKIKVCGSSIIDVTMPDGSIIRGGPGSEIDMSEQSCDAGRNFSFRLLMGSIWNEVSPYIGGENKYEVKTENAVTGSRGTKFLVKVTYDTLYDNPEKSVWTINKTTKIVCLEGVVEVSNSNGATLTDTATQVSLYEDFQAGRITTEEMQRKMSDIANNNKLLVNAGMETTVYNEQPPTPTVPTRLRLEDFSQDNMVK